MRTKKKVPEKPEKGGSRREWFSSSNVTWRSKTETYSQGANNSGKVKRMKCL